MLSFQCDYAQGCLPEILDKIQAINLEGINGYGEDHYSYSAAKKIKEACGLLGAKGEASDVYFLLGGTQTNQVIISTMLDATEGVIATATGHVAMHEAGAIEYSGHKVITVGNMAENGDKLSATMVENYIEDFYQDASHEHMVYPGMVYISHPTEYGNLYTKEELTQLAAVCQKHSIPLFLDGARLGYGLAVSNSDVNLQDIAELADVFYIGGTKVGAMFGEAVVFTHNNMPKRFVTKVKQHGAMLAKGWLTGVQFDVLFTDDLYLLAGKNGIKYADQLREILKEKGYKFFLTNPTNQIFVVMENHKLTKLEEQVQVSHWEKYDESHTVVRFATSWATTQEMIDQLEQLL